MLPIAGLQKTTLIDYPHKLASILFTPGCNLRCPYCHNPELVKVNQKLELIPEDVIFHHLRQRRHLLDGVVITGGEPTLHPEELKVFCSRLKDLGYLIKLDTNGSRPTVLKELLEQNLIDYLAMDYKTLSTHYSILSAESESDLSRQIRDSIQWLMSYADQGKIQIEFRTTLHPKLHTKELFQLMVDEIKHAPTYILQTFRNQVTLDPAYQTSQPFTESQMNEFLQIAKPYFKQCLLR